jgi:GT2 family glycosyltransferase
VTSRVHVNPEPPRVEILVLNFNGAAHLESCLDSLLGTDYPNFGVVVIDNDSSDDSWRLADRADDRVTLIRNSRNLGWSGGNNVGVRWCLDRQTPYVLLANNDIAAHPAWVRQAVQAAERDAAICAVGFDVHDAAERPDAPATFEAAYRNWVPLPPQAVTQVGGMAMLVRTSVFREIGLFDESFWAYGEETDFLRRAAMAGYTMSAVNTPVWHVGGGSFGRGSWQAALLQTENNIQLLLKHASPSDTVRAATRHVWTRCMPGRRAARSSAVERRLAGHSFLVNTGLLLAASARIALKLPRILSRRRADRRAIEASRLRRGLA